MSVSFTAGKKEAELGFHAFLMMKHHVLKGIGMFYFRQFQHVWEHVQQGENDKANIVYETLLAELERKGHKGAMFFVRAYDTDWTFSAAEVKEIAPLLDRTDFGNYENDKSKREDMFAVRDLFLYAKKHNAKVVIS